MSLDKRDREMRKSSFTFSLSLFTELYVSVPEKVREVRKKVLYRLMGFALAARVSGHEKLGGMIRHAGTLLHGCVCTPGRHPFHLRGPVFVYTLSLSSYIGEHFVFAGLLHSLTKLAVDTRLSRLLEAAHPASPHRPHP